MSVVPGAVSAAEFYAEYKGHKVSHLEAVVARLRHVTKARRFVYLAGDSSLDNKHWFFEPFEEKVNQLAAKSHFVDDAVNGYEFVLRPPLMVKDVSYWLNCEFAQRARDGAVHTCCVNTSIEESALSDREGDTPLLPQDIFIRDNITEEDVLIVDVGGNDVALKPTTGVIFNMALLLYLTPTFMIRNHMAVGMLYFLHMFRSRLQAFIERLISKKKPKKVIVCMLYFLDEKPGGSWADAVLEKLGYNADPVKLQTVIRRVYEDGVCKISIPGVEVVPVPLFEVLDGKDTTDYVQRVEPSVSGGRKMAQALAKHVFD